VHRASRAAETTGEQSALRLHTQFTDVRLVDGDHFLVFLRPDLVAEVIAETLATVS